MFVGLLVGLFVGLLVGWLVGWLVGLLSLNHQMHVEEQKPEPSTTQQYNESLLIPVICPTHLIVFTQSVDAVFLQLVQGQHVLA